MTATIEAAPAPRSAASTPLTPEQQRLVTDGEPRSAAFGPTSAWVGRTVAMHSGRALRDYYGEDALQQEMWLALINAARKWNPDGPTSLHTYFLTFAKNHLKGLYRMMRGKGVGFTPLPDSLEAGADAGAAADVAPALAAWCETRPQRDGWTWRQRLVVALRCVEGMTPRQIAELFGVRRQIINRVVSAARLAAA